MYKIITQFTSERDLNFTMIASEECLHAVLQKVAVRIQNAVNNGAKLISSTITPCTVSDATVSCTKNKQDVLNMARSVPEIKCITRTMDFCLPNTKSEITIYASGVTEELMMFRKMLSNIFNDVQSCSEAYTTVDIAFKDPTPEELEGLVVLRAGIDW